MPGPLHSPDEVPGSSAPLGAGREPTCEQLVEMLREAREVAAKEAARHRVTMEFFGRFARELLLPLNAVAGSARLLQETPLEPMQAQTVRRVIEASDELTGPLKDLHRFAAIQTGTFRAWPNRFSLAEIAQTLVGQFSATYRPRGLEVAVDIAPEVPRELRADPVAVREILGHLLAHALRETPRGTVEVQFGVRDTDGNEICLYGMVRDGGRSLTADEAHELFEPFTAHPARPDGLTVRPELGLALAAGLVEQLDGALWHEANPGEGNTFHFALWVERADPAHTGPSDRRFNP